MPRGGPRVRGPFVLRGRRLPVRCRSRPDRREHLRRHHRRVLRAGAPRVRRARCPPSPRYKVARSARGSGSPSPAIFVSPVRKAGSRSTSCASASIPGFALSTTLPRLVGPGRAADLLLSAAARRRRRRPSGSGSSSASSSKVRCWRRLGLSPQRSLRAPPVPPRRRSATLRAGPRRGCTRRDGARARRAGGTRRHRRRSRGGPRHARGTHAALQCSGGQENRAHDVKDVHYKKPGWFTRNVFNRTSQGSRKRG